MTKSCKIANCFKSPVLMGKDANLTLFLAPSTNIREEIGTINMYVNKYRRVGP